MICGGTYNNKVNLCFASFYEAQHNPERALWGERRIDLEKVKLQ
jgi:hypothetical protein